MTRHGAKVPGVGRGAHRVRGMPGSFSDGRVGPLGDPFVTRCPRCRREYESGVMSERRGRRCVVCGADLFPHLTRKP